MLNFVLPLIGTGSFSTLYLLVYYMPDKTNRRRLGSLLLCLRVTSQFRALIVDSNWHGLRWCVCVCVCVCFNRLCVWISVQQTDGHHHQELANSPNTPGEPQMVQSRLWEAQ